MGKKVLATIVGFLILVVLGFTGYVMKNYGDFSNIRYNDVNMWIFLAVFGILIFLLLAVILRYPHQEEPVEEQTEEEAPEELQTEEALEIEVPEISEMNIDDQEPQEHKDRKASEIQPPAIWEEEEFE